MCLRRVAFASKILTAAILSFAVNVVKGRAAAPWGRSRAAPWGRSRATLLPGSNNSLGKCGLCRLIHVAFFPRRLARAALPLAPKIDVVAPPARPIPRPRRRRPGNWSRQAHIRPPACQAAFQGRAYCTLRRAPYSGEEVCRGPAPLPNIGSAVQVPQRAVTNQLQGRPHFGIPITNPVLQLFDEDAEPTDTPARCVPMPHHCESQNISRRNHVETPCHGHVRVLPPTLAAQDDGMILAGSRSPGTLVGHGQVGQGPGLLAAGAGTGRPLMKPDLGGEDGKDCSCIHALASTVEGT
jgi:hypothetical protein